MDAKGKFQCAQLWPENQPTPKSPKYTVLDLALAGHGLLDARSRIKRELGVGVRGVSLRWKDVRPRAAALAEVCMKDACSSASDRGSEEVSEVRDG